jgi:ATP-dependent DNA helicase RecQ
VGVVAEVLAGAQNEKASRWKFDQLSVFGLLRAHSAKRIVAMLHRLMEAGLARQRDPDGVKFRPVIDLTAAGVRVMKGEQPPPVGLADLLPRGTSGGGGTAAVSRSEPGSRVRYVAGGEAEEDVSPEVLERFERLRQARLKLARELQLPPYVICHDSTLKLIARSAPATLASLGQIKGMGPHKVKTYGPALLAAIGGEAAAEASGREAAEDPDVPF